MSPGRRSGSPDRLRAENERLKHDLEASSDAFEREVALRMQSEAERSMAKAEELWRVTSENERLKADLESERMQVAALTEKLASMEVAHAAYADELAAARAETATARAEADQFGNALAKLNRHAVGLCNSCGSLYNGRRKLETAAYRSNSPRFGKAFEHAAAGGKAGDNVALSEGKAMPGPGSHRSHRDARGNLIATGLTGAVEPYSSAVTSTASSSVHVHLS